jgi:nucleoid-associated protein YgaU
MGRCTAAKSKAKASAASAKAAAKAKATRAANAEAKAKAQAADAALKDQRNFLTQGKNAKDENVRSAYNHYMGLGRFSAEKKQLLEMWKKDKSCKWFLNYERTQSQQLASNSNGLKGYGTLLLSCISV